MKKMNPVVHFEMPYKNKNRMADFYTKVFGWHMQMTGPEMGNYVVAATTESDQKSGRPKNPGTINGGFYEKSKGNGYPSVVIAVDDIKEHIKMVKNTGGKILGEQMEIPNVGWYVSFVDTEGNKVSILQPTQM